MSSKHNIDNKVSALSRVNIKSIAFAIYIFVLIVIMTASSVISVILIRNDKTAQNDDSVIKTEQQEKPLIIKQVKSTEMPGIYENFTAKIDITKLNSDMASDPNTIKTVNEYNQANQSLPSTYFGLVRDGRFIEQILILTPCSSTGKISKTNASMSSTNEYAKYGAFICQSHTVEIPINLPNGAKIRPDLGSSYETKIDAANEKLYMDISWSILADGTDVYYSSSDYNGYQWTIQNADNKTVRTYLVKLVPMLSDEQLEFLDDWKSRIDAKK